MEPLVLLRQHRRENVQRNGRLCEKPGNAEKKDSQRAGKADRLCFIAPRVEPTEGRRTCRQSLTDGTRGARFDKINQYDQAVLTLVGSMIPKLETQGQICKEGYEYIADVR